MVSTPDELRFDGHLTAIRDEAGYTVPGGPAYEMADLFATIIAPGPA